MQPILEIKNISKKYRIQHEQQPYLSLRDSIAGFFASPHNPLSKRRGGSGGEDFWALKDISFDVYPGESIGVIGKNGAGKSTLLKILSKITPPTEGKIISRGRIASLLEVGTGFHLELTGRENVFLNGSILGMKKREILKKFDEIVDFSGVEKFIDTPLKHYSSGMQLRLAFAVAAFLEPEILLIDEVLAVGDAEFQKKCLGKMEDVTKKEGRTVLFVSHNMGTIANLCSKSVLLINGEINSFDSTNNCINRYLTYFRNYQSTTIVSDSMRHTGDGNITILQCTLLNKNNLPQNSFLIGEDFFVKMRIKSNISTKDICFWIIIANNNEDIILCSHQKDTTNIIVEEGDFNLVFSTKDISLLPGTYFIWAGAMNTNYNHFYEYVKNCQQIEILSSFANGNNYDNRSGYINHVGKWFINDA